jgi:hypothetical protein
MAAIQSLFTYPPKEESLYLDKAIATLNMEKFEIIDISSCFRVYRGIWNRFFVEVYNDLKPNS